MGAASSIEGADSRRKVDRLRQEQTDRETRVVTDAERKAREAKMASSEGRSAGIAFRPACKCRADEETLGGCQGTELTTFTAPAIAARRSAAGR